MGKKLAIKGHPTRSKEVIELLEMMGGNDSNAFRCINPNLIYYVLDNHTHWDYIGPEEIDEYNIFTLKEFLEKFPFKVGDVIKFPNNMAEEIAEMKWDEELEDIIYTSVSGWTRPCYVNNKTNMKTDCKKCGLHFGSVRCFDKDCSHNTPKSYAVSLVGDKVIDNLTYKDIDMNTCKDTAHDVHKKIAYLSINNEDYADQIEINLGDNYEYKFEMNRLYVVKKKPKYPTTYEDCYDESNIESHFIYVDKDERDLYESFIQLIRCRNAYWKIAGDEMGLDKPWEPDWTNLDQLKYCIWVDVGEIITMINVRGQHILAFPTEEIRDAFFKNFKKEIEQCKELL